MALLIIILLIIAAATGALWAILKVAVAVAFGIFLGFALLAGLVAWRIRRALRGSQPRWRRVAGSSRVEVLEPPK